MRLCFLSFSSIFRVRSLRNGKLASVLVIGGLSSVSSGTGMAARETNTTGASCAGSSSTRIACSTPTSSPSSHSTHHSYRPRDGLYTAPPSSFKLQQVVIIARHGDRAPIARNVGQAVQDSPETQALWLSKLPSSQEVEAWTSAFPLADPSLRPVDYDEHPYAQLTRKGAQELQALGRHLRKRYVTDLKWLPASLHASGGHAPHASGGLSSAPSSSSPPSSSPPSFLHARATNIRRTQQSAQNLLLGLYPDGAPHPSPSSSAPPLAIQVRPTASETLYPNADRSCCRQGEIIAELASRHFDMPRAHVEDMTREAFARLGLVPHPEPASAKVDPAVPPPAPPLPRALEPSARGVDLPRRPRPTPTPSGER
ncbi:histidine acid, partial [Nannochloropsis gaditana]